MNTLTFTYAMVNYVIPAAAILFWVLVGVLITQIAWMVILRREEKRMEREKSKDWGYQLNCGMRGE